MKQHLLSVSYLNQDFQIDPKIIEQNLGRTYSMIKK